MLGQIVAFLTVATSVAFASNFGCCYPGYGGYCGSPVVGAGLYNNVFCGSRILGTGCSTPAFAATVGAPEVISSCENSVVAPVLSNGIMSSGLYGTEYNGSPCGLSYGCESINALDECGSSVIANSC